MARIETASRVQMAQVAVLRHTQSGVSVDARDRFVATLLSWADAHQDTHLCLVAVEGEVVVGYGFLVLVERTPSPDKAIRRSADVQTLFVVPGRRGIGIGGQLVAALVQLARLNDVEHVTVHGNERAAALYRRAGFRIDTLLLYRPV